jgi:hypothetical protein
MIERVAQAVRRRQLERTRRIGALDGPVRLPEHTLDNARAAIRGMREPTALMLEAGGNFIEDDCSNPREPQMRAAWMAMIDEALK